ncbi:sensor histidine kinase [Modestobacter excelsi]|uniref:sensor histidine kinase n=1 Tax=Modestobacter excelsi TaxID=2213161 RepID=UPI00110CD6AF|nr:histidine kinase [Modestobacter excelsi]
MGIRTRLWPGLPLRAVWLEVLLATVSAVAVTLTGRAPDDADLLPLPVDVAGTVVLVVLLLAFRRRAPLVPFAVSVLLTALSPPVTIALLVTAYAVGRYDGRWPVRIAAAVLGSVAVLQPWGLPTANETIGAVGLALVAVVLPGALGAWARTRAELLAALTERAERAESERELLAREAVLSERTRIAREMHDTVGHRVSLMVLQAGAIEMAAADQRRVEQLAGNVQSAGRQALDELRQMVGVLRGSDVDEGAPLGPQPGIDDLLRLVTDARRAGMTVDLVAGDPDAAPVDPAVGRAVYRIVQEALTNAGRHAPGAPVCVRVDRAGGELVVRVVNGPPREARVAEARGGGYGLVGLAERVRTLGGRLTAEPRLDGGFGVEAVLPT